MPTKLERRIGINAPDEIIWELLSDIPGWASWNPIYPKAQGVIRIGDQWTLDLALPAQEVQTINPVILDWAPYDHIHWRSTMMRGWVKTVRYLELEKMGDENIIFSNGEIFDGMLSGYYVSRMRNPLLRGFEALNVTLKEKAEAIWQERRVSAK